jgi:hypothetical protein
MAQITVKYDPTLKIEEIVEPMYATSEDECAEDRPAEIQQTKVTGILSPLIQVNKIVILWDKVTKFELSSTGFLPELRFTFKDDLGFTKSLDQPGNDNLVLLKILPPFEDAYKKIELRFFINDVSIKGDKVSITASYNVPALLQDKLQSFGKITTYDYLDKVAKECELGLASNLEGTEDERYIYLRNTNFVKSIENEIKHSGNESCVLDTWIDFHNYVVLCDMLERYNAFESEIKVWTAPTAIPDTSNTGEPIKPKEEDAILSNAIAMRTSQLYIKEYNVKNSAGNNIKSGTDKVLQTYFIDKSEPFSILIQDGDAKKDTFIKTIYKGELFGEYDYFTSEFCRSAFLQKINSNTIEVALSTPLLGLERGGKVNIQWYEVNEIATVIKNENPIETNVPDDEGEQTEKNEMTLNKQVSGQYFIIGTTIKFLGWEKGWKYILTLTRPTDQVNTYLGDNE